MKISQDCPLIPPQKRQCCTCDERSAKGHWLFCYFCPQALWTSEVIDIEIKKSEASIKGIFAESKKNEPVSLSISQYQQGSKPSYCSSELWNDGSETDGFSSVCLNIQVKQNEREKSEGERQKRENRERERERERNMNICIHTYKHTSNVIYVETKRSALRLRRWRNFWHIQNEKNR